MTLVAQVDYRGQRQGKINNSQGLNDSEEIINNFVKTLSSNKILHYTQDSDANVVTSVVFTNYDRY